jgi:hypothetical protein
MRHPPCDDHLNPPWATLLWLVPAALLAVLALAGTVPDGRDPTELPVSAGPGAGAAPAPAREGGGEIDASAVDWSRIEAEPPLAPLSVAAYD